MTGERGSGLLGAVLAVGAVCALLGLASDVAVGLWTRTTVEAVAEDAARRIARAPADDPPRAAADREFARARHLLGPAGRRVRLELADVTPQHLVVQLRWEGRRLLPALAPGGPTVASLNLRIVVRRQVPG